jgi:hypothetical protein
MSDTALATVSSTGSWLRPREREFTPCVSFDQPDSIQTEYGTKVHRPRFAGRRRAFPVLIGDSAIR